MTTRFRVWVCWSPQRARFGEMAASLTAFMGAIQGVHPKLAPWQFHSREANRNVALSGAGACERALGEGRDTWRTGDTDRVAYRVKGFSGDRLRPSASFTLTCGIEPTGIPTFTPNRIDFEIDGSVDGSAVTRTMFELLLRVAVESFTPDFGFVGMQGHPNAPTAMYHDGSPVVGWMTYLAPFFPAVPQKFPAPGGPLTLGVRGAVLLSHPVLFDPSFPRHIAAIDTMRETLHKAGVLVPVSRVRPVATQG